MTILQHTETFFRKPPFPIASKPSISTQIEAAAFEQMTLNNRLMALVLLSQSPMAAGRYEASMIGTTVPAAGSYIELVKNKQSNPIGVTVSAVFNSPPGVHVKLSLSTDTSDELAVDYLGNAASAPSFGKLISRVILLLPQQSLFIATAFVAPNPVPGATDKFTILAFDPMAYIADRNWEAKK